MEKPRSQAAWTEERSLGHTQGGVRPGSYLNARGIAINAMFFQVFSHGDDKFLSRAWLIDPGETQINAATTVEEKAQKQEWNGEYYAAFGDAESRSWEDARKYGYIAAGVGPW
jgi:hypothetical protein